MKTFGGVLLLLFVLLLPVLFGMLIWGAAWYFNAPQGVGQIDSLALAAIPSALRKRAYRVPLPRVVTSALRPQGPGAVGHKRQAEALLAFKSLRRVPFAGRHSLFHAPC